MSRYLVLQPALRDTTILSVRTNCSHITTLELQLTLGISQRDMGSETRLATDGASTILFWVSAFIRLASCSGSQAIVQVLWRDSTLRA